MVLDTTSFARRTQTIGELFQLEESLMLKLTASGDSYNNGSFVSWLFVLNNFLILFFAESLDLSRQLGLSSICCALFTHLFLKDYGHTSVSRVAILRVETAVKLQISL